MALLNINFISADISIDENSCFWTCNASISSIEDFENIIANDSFIINIAGEIWNFIVVSKKIDKTYAKTAFTIVGKSPTCLLDTPYRLPLEYVLLKDTNAKEVVSQVLDFNSLNWELRTLLSTELDWVLPMFSLAETASSRIEVAKKIVEAAGGVLECEPDGTFVVRNLYSISPLQYPTIVPDHFFSDIENVIASNFQYDLAVYYDYVRVRNTSNSEPSDKIEMIFDENSNLTGFLKVYPYPFRNVELETTASDLVITLDQSSKQEEIRLEEDELIEFAKGASSTKFPIYEVVSITWQDLDLKGIVFDIDTTTLYSTSPDFAYSLAHITYKTRCLKWKVTSSKSYDAQFLVIGNI